MIQTINRWDFEDAFKSMGRATQFSYHGLVALYDYLEKMEEETGVPFELDVVALCCEYTEYDNYYQATQDYRTDCYERKLGDITTVIHASNGAVIVQDV